MRLDLILCDHDTGGSIQTDCEEAGWNNYVYSSIEEFLAEDCSTPLVILVIPVRWKKSNAHINLLEEWHSSNPHTQIILIAPKDHRTADKIALKLGARYHLLYPYDSDDLVGILSKIARGLGKRKQRDSINMHLHRPDGFDEIIGESEKIQEVLQLARKVGQSEYTSLMITGENGTGKGALARAIHQISSRSSEPFIEVNCAAIPKNLLESEFFGHEKGAFTDAKERKMGLFELANGGTIFLDEIGEIEYGLQAKLLKFLDSRTIRRISGTQFLPVDVNIISATNRDLKDLIESRRFRTDLYYRLNVIEIKLPPLRDRIEDIRPIALKYTEKFASNLKKEKPVLTEDAFKLLEEYSWPGNIRELINMIERAVLLDADGEINSEDLPIRRQARETTLDFSDEQEILRINIPPEGVSLEEVEKGLILATLERTGGNITRAAGLLKVERGTLRYKMKKYGINAAELEQKNETGEYTPAGVTD